MFFLNKKTSVNLPITHETYCKKNFIIFGGGTGYGFEIAKYIFSLGGNIILVSKNKKKLLQAKQKILVYKKYNNKIFTYKFDLLNFSLYPNMFLKIKKKFNSINAVIHCAAHPGKINNFPILFSPDQYLKNSIKINFLSNIYMLRNFMKIFKFYNKTKFIFFSSKAGWSDTLGHGVYNITKSGLNSFINSASEELRNHPTYSKYELICIEPGEAKTEMNKASKTKANVILNVISKLLNSRKNLNGLFIDRDLNILNFLNSKKINLYD